MGVVDEFVGPIGNRPRLVGAARGQTAAQGSVALVAAFFVTAVLNYAFAILMSWLLPVDRYGLLGVVQTVLLLGGTIVSAGFPWALTRAVARKPERAASAALIRSALIANLLIGLGLAGLLYFGTLLGLLPFGADYVVPMLLAGVTIATLAIYSVFTAALQGMLRFTALGVLNVVEVAAKCMCGLALVLLGFGARGAITGFLAGAVLVTLLSTVLLRDLRFWRGQDRHAADVYADVAPFFLGTLSLALLVNFDIIGLKLFSIPARSNDLTGQYQAAVTLARIPIFVALALFNAVFPYLAKHPSHSAMAKAYASLALKYTLLFIVPVDLALMVRPASILHVFYAPAYGASAPPLMVAAFGTILLTFIQAATVLLQAAGRLRRTVLVLPAAVLLEILASWWLVPRLATVGAAVALVVAGVFGLSALTPEVRSAYRLALTGRLVLAYCLAVATFIVALALIPQGGRVTTVAGIAVASLIYALMLGLLALLTPGDVDILSRSFGGRFSPWLVRTGAVVAHLNRVARAAPRSASHAARDDECRR